MGNTFKDYIATFLGTFFLFLSIFLIPEIRRNKTYRISILILCALTTYLGIDKINRDNKKDFLNVTQRINDSTTIQNVSSKLDSISNKYSKDSARFSDFKKKLESDFHIIDSANKPIQIHNFNPVFNTHINKARDVKIG